MDQPKDPAKPEQSIRGSTGAEPLPASAVSTPAVAEAPASSPSPDDIAVFASAAFLSCALNIGYALLVLSVYAGLFPRDSGNYFFSVPFLVVLATNLILTALLARAKKTAFAAGIVAGLVVDIALAMWVFSQIAKLANMG